MTFKLMVVKEEYKKKPQGLEIGKIKNSFKDPTTIVEVTPKELFEFIGKGYTISPCVAKNGLKKENFISSQLIILDIDNSNSNIIITPEEVLDELKHNNFQPLGYHESFNSTDEKPKFHVLLLMEEPIYEPNKMEFILKTLQSCIKQSDIACKDVSRMYFTTNGEEKKIVLWDQDAIVKWEDILNYAHKNNIDFLPNNSSIRNKQIQKLEEDFDLYGFMKERNKPVYGENNNSNYVMFDTCCICGHKKDLVYYKDSNRFHCFGANGSIGGSAIDYIKLVENKSEPEAIEFLKNSKYYHKKVEEKEDYEDKKDDKSYKDKCIKEVISQLEKYNINITPEDIDWIEYIYTKKGLSGKVLCPKLAKAFKKVLNFIFIESSTDNKTIKYIYRDGVYKLISDKKLESFIKAFIPENILKSNDYKEVLELLSTDTENYISFDKLNTDENIINFRNGIYHFDTDELTAHTPECMSTIQIPCDYEPNPLVPTTGYFDKFINTISNNNKDEKKLLLQYLGIAISNIYGYRMKSALLLISEGDTGKSQLINLITALLGKENCTTIDLSELDKPFKLIHLNGKRFASFNDLSGIKMKSMSQFKMLTGGDNITDSFKGKDFIDFKFHGVLVFAGNLLPKWGLDRGDHVYRRMIFLEPKNIIPVEKQDKHLLEKLLTETPYIVSQLIKGAKEVISNGYRYDIPNSSLKIRNEFRIENDSVLTFINECMETVIRNPERDDLTTGQVYQLYLNWYKINIGNKNFEGNRNFVNLMKKNGVEISGKTHNGHNYYMHLVPTQDAIDNYWLNNNRY